MGRRDPVGVCKITKFSEWDNDVIAHRSRRPECPLQVSHEGMEEISKTSRLGNEASIQTQAVQSTDTVPALYSCHYRSYSHHYPIPLNLNHQSFSRPSRPREIYV